MHYSMKQNQQAVRHERRISASRLRRFLADIAEDITDGLDTVNVVARGNTFAIHLEGATINISVNTAREGGNA